MAAKAKGGAKGARDAPKAPDAIVVLAILGESFYEWADASVGGRVKFLREWLKKGRR